MNFRTVYICLVVLSSLLVNIALAEDLPNAEPDMIVEVETEATVQEKLIVITNTIEQKKKEKQRLQTRLRQSSTKQQQGQLQEELNAVDDIIQGMRDEFIAVATGRAELFIDPNDRTEDFDWQRDLEMIVKPLLSQLRDLSERPRLIEEIETDIILWQERVEELTKASSNLSANLAIVDNRNIKRRLEQLLSSANSRLNSAEQKLTLLNNSLDELLQKENPLWENLGSIVKTTVVSMVAHLFLAIFAAFFVYNLIGFIASIPVYILNKKRYKKYILAERAIHLVKRFTAIVCATLTYLIVLYSFSEWLILVISVLVVVAALISLKDAIPQYLVEIRTLLNLGSVRQGEVIHYEGVLWQISTIDIYTELHNPPLDAKLRIPITKIADLHSRPMKTDELLFPTLVGDVVLLQDGIFGKITRQSPEYVQVTYGGATDHYQTCEFLKRRPRNLSQGFTLFESFGIDYAYQSMATTEVISLMKKSILDAIKKSPFNEYKTHFDIEFEKADDSSLEYKVIVSFTGAVAEQYYKIQRFIQKSAVDAANANNWVIPFTQVTLHKANTE